MPIFLIHLWLPKASVEAPVSGSMILAGVLLKLGGYGLLRVFSVLINSEFCKRWAISCPAPRLLMSEYEFCSMDSAT
jgi:NADH-ubiquinone oxidoreductase chain 4